MGTLDQIYHSIDSLKIIEGDKCAVLELLGTAIRCIEDAQEKMGELTVRGRHNLDVLLGCMMAAESLTGKDNNNG